MQYLILQTDSDACSLLLVEESNGKRARVVTASKIKLAKTPLEQAIAIRAAAPMLKRGARLVLVLAGSDLRYRQVGVPQAPADELPQIVQIQVQRLAASEEIAVDYVPAPEGEEQEHEVLAAWCDQSTLTHWEETAEELRARALFAAPRALCSASLAGNVAESVLVATSEEDQIDFVLFNRSTPVMARSTVLAEEEGSAERELRRTMLAISDEVTQESPITVIHDGLFDEATKSESLRLERLDVERTISELLEPSGAPISLAQLGSLRWALSEEKPPIDLAHPRGTDLSEATERPRITILAATALVLLAGAWMAYAHLANLRGQLESAQQRLNEAEESVKKFSPYVQRVEKIDAWRASDVTWLDELDRLGHKLRPQPLSAKDFPTASDVRVTQLLATVRVGSGEPGGVIVLSARAKSASTQEVEARLRDRQHAVEPQSTAEVESPDGYNYQYVAKIVVPAEVDEAPELSSEAEESKDESDATAEDAS